jgi:hypothetical protein
MGHQPKQVKSEKCKVKSSGNIPGREALSSISNPISTRGNFYIQFYQSANLSAETVSQV